MNGSWVLRIKIFPSLRLVGLRVILISSSLLSSSTYLPPKILCLILRVAAFSFALPTALVFLIFPIILTVVLNTLVLLPFSQLLHRFDVALPMPLFGLDPIR